MAVLNDRSADQSRGFLVGAGRSPERFGAWKLALFLPALTALQPLLTLMDRRTQRMVCHTEDVWDLRLLRREKEKTRLCQTRVILQCGYAGTTMSVGI